MDAELRRQMLLARELYQHHEYDRAEPLLQAILAQEPGAAEPNNLLGIICHQRGRFGEAQQRFERALAQNPDYTEAALNLAVVCNDTGQYQAGEAVLLALKARQAAGGVAAGRGEGSSAGVDRFALGRLANLHAATAEGYRALGMYPAAIAEYQRALALCPGFPDLRVGLATLLSEHGDHQGAVAAYRQLVALSPRYAQGFVLLGMELFALGQHDEARAAWEQALALEPDNRRLGVYLGWVNDNRGAAAAVASDDRGAAASPRSPTPLLDTAG